MKKVRVGILGGSFDPPHPGHIHISQLAHKKLNLKQIWWVPTVQNPLKTEYIKQSYFERIKLCKQLTKNLPYIKVKDLEYRFFGPAKKFYTYNLLRKLNAKFKDHKFYLILGADSLVNFHKWYKYQEISNLAEIIVFNRSGFKQKAMNSRVAKMKNSKFIYSKTMNISSTELRTKK